MNPLASKLLEINPTHRGIIGKVNSKTKAASVAHMRSPGNWQEPGQTPEFDEFTIVLKGMLREHVRGTIDVSAGQAVIAHRGELGPI